MKKVIIALIVVVIILGAVGGAEYYASTQITYQVSKISIDSFVPQLNMRFWINFTSPTGIPIWVSGGTDHLAIDGNEVGDGVFGQIPATTTGTLTAFTLNYTGNMIPLAKSAFNYIEGYNVSIEVTIKTITVLWAINLPINMVETQNVNMYTS